MNTFRRESPTDLDPAGKSQGNSDGHNSKGIPPYGRNNNGGNMTVVVVDVFGQKVAQLPVTSEKTVWNSDGMKSGIYFYKLKIEGEVISGK
ncbi:MAG: hypothetical protein DRJ05_03035, partial [Bacteroidetes bacterium]